MASAPSGQLGCASPSGGAAREPRPGTEVATSVLDERLHDAGVDGGEALTCDPRRADAGTRRREPEESGSWSPGSRTWTHGTDRRRSQSQRCGIRGARKKTFDNPMRGSPDGRHRTHAETRRAPDQTAGPHAERSRKRRRGGARQVPTFGGGQQVHGRAVGAGTVPEDPTKTKVVTSPDARNHRAQRDGEHLEGPHRPSAQPTGRERGDARESGDAKAEEVERREIGRSDMPMSLQTRSDVGVEHREDAR